MSETECAPSRDARKHYMIVMHESDSLKLVIQSLFAIFVLVRSGWQVQLSLSRVNPVG